MTQCDQLSKPTPPPGAIRYESDPGPGQESETVLWISQFNWFNFIGLAMFIAPVLFGYGAVHYWLLQHDALLYYGSLYAQLGLLMLAWRQV